MRALSATALLALASCHATVEAQRTRMPEAAQLTPKAEPGRPKLAVSPAQTISTEGIKKLAQALRSKGLWAGPGQPGREELAVALKSFQTQAKLAATGYPDTETLHRLGLTPEDL